MTTPENTTDRDPLIHLVGAMGSGGSAGYITDMESAGQRELVHSDTLPARGPWAELEALGFVRTDRVPGDDLFVRCTIPDGWKRQGSDHAMWSHIVDDRGVRRVAVFYKAAFYDRDAFVSIVNVGSDLVSGIIYGDDDVALPDVYEVLTDDERAAFHAAVADHRAKVADNPGIYGRDGRGERSRLLAELIR